MSMGGKGGSESVKTEIPGWARDFALHNIDRAKTTSQIGYLPWYGPDVAAVNPLEQGAMEGAGSAAKAMGLLGQGTDVMAGMPEAQEFAGGTMGYSSAPMFEQAVNELRQRAPGYMSEYDKLFTSNMPAGYEGQQQTYFDPNNPEMVEAQEAARAAQQASGFPPGYEWLADLMYDPYGGHTGGGRRGFLKDPNAPSQPGYYSDRDLPPGFRG